jgi:hypothetical protein
LFTDISDNLPVFSICFEDKTYTRNVNDVIVFRDKNKQNVAKFNEKLGNVNWSQLDGYDDPNISCKTFLSKYTEIYNLSFPLRKVKANKSSISKQWLSKGLLKSVKMKNRLYKKYLSNPTLEHEMTYKRYKNKLNHSVRIAKF